MSHAAFLIDGVEYAIPQSYRLGDPVLIEEISGLRFHEFAERLTTSEWLIGRDPAVLVAVVAVAVWQQHEDWSREKVRKFIEALDTDQFDFKLPEQTETDADPPDEPAGESPSPTSSDGSTTTAEESGSATTPDDSGQQGSRIGSQD